MERLSLEAQLEYVDGFNDSPVNVDIWNVMGNVKAFILTDRFQPYALFGMGVVSGETLAKTCADDIERIILEQGREIVAAVFLEPVQNSGGFFPPPRATSSARRRSATATVCSSSRTR